MFSDELRSRLETYVRTLPSDLLEPSATDDQLVEFESKFERIPEVYRWFLLNYGGGVFGTYTLDGIHQLFRSHEKFQREAQSDLGWTMRDVFVIAWDASGNPVAIENRSGRVVVEDHDFGGIHTLASNFEQFLRRLISQTEDA